MPDSSSSKSTLRKTISRLLNPDFKTIVFAFKLIVWWIVAFAALAGGFLIFSALKPMLRVIPAGIQFACAGLLVLAVTLLVAMLRERGRVLAACDHCQDTFHRFPATNQAERLYGLAPERMKELRAKGNALRGRPKEWWRNVEESLECYTSADGRQGWFITRPVAESVTEDDVISGFYNASFYQVVPSILTALGLLATFIAILTALSGVTYNAQDPTHPVTGIETLINGLSGKFLSSIVALILSVIFIFFEKKVCERQIYREYDRLIKRYKELLPFLSQSRILLDIQRLTAGQTGLVRPLEMDESVHEG